MASVSPGPRSGTHNLEVWGPVFLLDADVLADLLPDLAGLPGWKGQPQLHPGPLQLHGGLQQPDYLQGLGGGGGGEVREVKMKEGRGGGKKRRRERKGRERG